MRRAFRLTRCFLIEELPGGIVLTHPDIIFLAQEQALRLSFGPTWANNSCALDSVLLILLLSSAKFIARVQSRQKTEEWRNFKTVEFLSFTRVWERERGGKVGRCETTVELKMTALAGDIDLAEKCSKHNVQKSLDNCFFEQLK